MVQDFFLLMRSELMLILIIFGLLFLKLGNARLKNETVMNMVNAVLIATLAMCFLVKDTGMTLGTLIISLQSYQWLKAHKHAMEFYLLLISTLLGMFFMLSSANLLMFYLGLELSTIPLAAMVNFDLHKK